MTTSERREAVAKAIHYYRGEWEYVYEDGINGVPVPFEESVFRGISLAQADAALAAALPNRRAFADAVNRLIRAVDAGTDVDAVPALWQLVYGMEATE